MKKTISLDTSQIKNLIEELNSYQKSLNEKCVLLTNRLATQGIKVINIEYGSGNGDSSREHQAWYEPQNDMIRGKIVVQGEDILFIEFGSGIRFNHSPHPKAHEFGYGVGTYPGQTHAYDPNGWYYRENGILHHSLGTEATMPLYKAMQEMCEKVEEIAKEVFSSE